ncbi:NAD(P)-dependent oxidoreductase [Candidatus Woesearchaeota archaeon]|nr:NAD(P)-dependent oxidoreductase [Candidatus Woesearchaeota archaeon]
MDGSIKKVLVTGSSGTIGTALCEALLEKGYGVKGVDMKQNKWNKAVDAVTSIIDLRKKPRLKALNGQYDLIVHLAANARVYDLVKKPEMAKDNIIMMWNVLEFARKNHVPRILFSSSREVYGNTEKFTHAEDEARMENCESPYTASKIAGEALMHAYRHCYNMRAVIMRFSNVYGKYDESNRVVPLFYRLCKEGNGLKVFGKDKMLDFTYISDCVAGVMQIIGNFEKVNGEVINLAYGQGTTILEVAQMIQKEMNVSTPIKVTNNRTGEVVKYVADITKAKQVLNFNPQVPIAEGIKRSIEWYKTNI